MMNRKDFIMAPNLTDQCGVENHRIMGELMESAAGFVIYQLSYEEDNPYLFNVNFVSPSIKDILGISEPMKFQKWFENVHPDDRKAVEKAHLKAFETGQFDEIFRICHPKKKEIRWVRGLSTSMALFQIGNKKQLEVMGFIVDMTNQKKMEMSLLESNERYQSIIETIPDMTFEFDLEGRITFCSKAVENLLGYTLEEIKGKSFREMISPETLQTAIEGFKTMIAGKPIENVQLGILRKDGKSLTCVVRGGPLIIEGKVVGVQGIARKFSARKKTEIDLIKYHERLEAEVSARTRDLMKSEARYRGIVEDSRDMVCRFLLDGTITFVNQVCNNYTEGTIQDLLGYDFFEWIAAGEDPELSKNDINSPYLGDFPVSFDRQLRLADGSIRWIRWSGHRLYNGDDSFSEYQAVGQDITEQKEAEIEKRKAEQFHKRAQKLEALGTLSAGIAHDFNNILAVLLGNVQLALDDVPQESRSRKNLDEMINAILRARDMVKQILTFCRKGEQLLRPLSLTPVVKESIKFLRSSIPATIEILENVNETDFVNADSTQISQVVMNLGSNAAHAMSGRTGALEISLDNITIDQQQKNGFGVIDEGRYVKMVVRDTGCGMSSEVASRVFDPYFTTKEEGEGSGMGLAVVHGIVEAHNGRIMVSSEIGKGSTFEILFPVVDGENIPEIGIPGPVIGGTERILLVDDRENLLKVEKDLLEHLGYQVTAKIDPIEALEAFRRQPHQFDLVYTDMTMPHMTGLTLSRKLLEIRPEIPIILYTGLGDLVDREEIQEIGIRAFLKKPILLEDLASTIREVLELGKN
jgi:PAS domain S-box-containing protein